MHGQDMSQAELRKLGVLVSRKGFSRLVEAFGGGPVVTGCHDSTTMERCEGCQLPQKRIEEKTRISNLDREAGRTATRDDPLYMIDALWLTQWRKFAVENGPRPGPISNDRLLTETGEPRAGLKKKADYRGLHSKVWAGLHELYGGGPAIVRDEMDIYSAPSGSTFAAAELDPMQESQDDNQNADEYMAKTPDP